MNPINMHKPQDMGIPTKKGNQPIKHHGASFPWFTNNELRTCVVRFQISTPTYKLFSKNKRIKLFSQINLTNLSIQTQMETYD